MRANKTRMIIGPPISLHKDSESFDSRIMMFYKILRLSVGASAKHSRYPLLSGEGEPPEAVGEVLSKNSRWFRSAIPSSVGVCRVPNAVGIQRRSRILRLLLDADSENLRPGVPALRGPFKRGGKPLLWMPGRALQIDGPGRGAVLPSTPAGPMTGATTKHFFWARR